MSLNDFNLTNLYFCLNLFFLTFIVFLSSSLAYISICNVSIESFKLLQGSWVPHMDDCHFSWHKTYKAEGKGPSVTLLAQNLQSGRQRAIRDHQKANNAIAKYMTRLIKSDAALYIILTYYYNEFHFRICDEEDVEVIEVLHSLYPLHRPVVSHCLTNSLSQSIIQSNLEMRMVVVIPQFYHHY